jgi:hypothetical protein
MPAQKKQPAGATDGPAGVKKVAGTGTEQTRFQSQHHRVVSSCDAECDALSPDRIELLTRAVVLVARMRIPEAAREAVLSRVTAELANAAGKSPHNHTKPAANAAVRKQGKTPGSQGCKGERECGPLGRPTAAGCADPNPAGPQGPQVCYPAITAGKCHVRREPRLIDPDAAVKRERY